MAVRKPCRNKGCRASPRCDHPWWLDVMHKHRRYRMPVDDFALARGATAPVASKQEAEKVWQPKFIAEIMSGKIRALPSSRPQDPIHRRQSPTCLRSIERDTWQSSV